MNVVKLAEHIYNAHQKALKLSVSIAWETLTAEERAPWLASAEHALNVLAPSMHGKIEVQLPDWNVKTGRHRLRLFVFPAKLSAAVGKAMKAGGRHTLARGGLVLVAQRLPGTTS